ncbi:tetratricopeptide repeat protein [Parvibaculum lavamentivorans]|uniref:tetratricopeptide repeat protein n=1 Tax=Parvibaculum lavamentivorans TaxID=256618 RepID=UPI0014472F7A|nr:tetratricopeptide repeat protein [Parvibaculum lavamentivorans]
MSTETAAETALPDRYSDVLTLLKEGRKRIAEEKCRALLAETPEDPDALALLASIVVESGRLEEAEQLLGYALKLAPTEPTPWMNLGRLLQQAGRWGDAMDHYHHAATLFPAHAGIAATLGQLYQRANRFTDAEAQYRRALENRPIPAYHMQLGMVLLRQERTDEAVEELQTAIKGNPNLAAAYGNLGNAEQKRGNIEAAAAAYEKAVALNPKDTLSYVSFGMARLKLGAAREAAEIFERALATHGPERRAAAWLPFARAQEFGDMPSGYRAEIGNLVSRATLTPPEGYASLADLNSALAKALKEDPTVTWEPLGKATRKGGQTGLLLDAPREPFIAFEKSLRRAIDAHFDSIKPQPGHPYRGQVPKTYHLDLWGTLLSEGGHQHSHIHVGGWMSGVYYVALPPALGTGEGSHDGWIEFGHPPPEFDAKFEPKTIAYEPREGDALFFPSYLFHRTLPFSGDVQRISLAFDVKPTSWR